MVHFAYHIKLFFGDIQLKLYFTLLPLVTTNSSLSVVNITWCFNKEKFIQDCF